ncbi:hypothetical protein MKX03_010277 [Papaver bracteatum]|nr:hypothetical protein MKX03_010277 [Papaver bracteatum]
MVITCSLHGQLISGLRAEVLIGLTEKVFSFEDKYLLMEWRPTKLQKTLQWLEVIHDDMLITPKTLNTPCARLHYAASFVTRMTIQFHLRKVDNNQLQLLGFLLRHKWRSKEVLFL